MPYDHFKTRFLKNAIFIQNSVSFPLLFCTLWRVIRNDSLRVRNADRKNGWKGFLFICNCMPKHESTMPLSLFFVLLGKCVLLILKLSGGRSFHPLLDEKHENFGQWIYQLKVFSCEIFTVCNHVLIFGPLLFQIVWELNLWSTRSWRQHQMMLCFWELLLEIGQHGGIPSIHGE